MVDIAKLGIEIDSKGAKKGADDLDQLSEASERATDSASKLGGAMGKLAKIAAGAFSAAAVGKFLTGSIKEAEKFEQSMLRTQAIIKATGGVAGKSAEGLREQAKAMARATLESTDGVERAQQTLLTFRKVQGDVFDRTIKAAADLSAALGGDLNSATMQLAKALENPTEGLSALSRSGTVFTAQQKEMVKGMIEAGQVAEAQAFILSELEAQYGGTAEAIAQGLSGVLDGVAQSWQELKLSVSESFGLAAGAAAAFGALDQALQSVAANMDTIAGTVTAVALGLTAYFAPAIVAGTVATGAFIVSLITLKGALIATGIGALVVAAGYLIGKLFELVRATGGWGNALSLLGEVAAGVWSGIVTSAGAIPPALAAVWQTVRANFYAMVQDLANAWAGFLSTLGAGYSKIPGMGSVGGALTGMAGGAAASMAEFDAKAQSALTSAAKLRAEAGEIATSGFDAATEAVGRLSEAVKAVPSIVAVGMPPVGDQATGAATGAAGGAGGGGGTDPYAASLQRLTDSLQTERDTVDAWYAESQAILADRRAVEFLGEEGHKHALARLEEEHQERLANIRQMAADSHIGTVLGAGEQVLSAMGQTNAKALAISKVFGAAQALVSTYQGAAEALKLPFPKNLAAAAAVLAKGIGFVTAIKGVSSSGGGSSGGGGSTAAQGTAAQEAPQSQTRLIIQGLRADDILTGQMLFDMFGEEADRRGIEFMGAA